MLNDSYMEQALKAKPGKDYYLKSILCILVIIIGAVGVLFTGIIGIVVMLAGIFMLYFFADERKLEYEYIFTNGSIEIAAIYNSNKRKELFSYEIDDVKMIVPKDSTRIKTESFSKKRDYSSRMGEGQVIAMVLESQNKKELVLLEPNEKALAHIKTYARNKMYDI